MSNTLIQKNLLIFVKFFHQTLEKKKGFSLTISYPLSAFILSDKKTLADLILYANL